MAEMIRTVSGLPMEEAGKLIEAIQAPLGVLVEDFGDRKLVLREMSAREEVLAILHTHYPERIATSVITASVDRRAAKTVRNTVRKLWTERLIEGDQHKGYKLTASGFSAAVDVIRTHS